MIVCWTFLELAEFLQMPVFFQGWFPQDFRIFTRVAARLLHTSVLESLFGCHRMAHRRRTTVPSIRELRALIENPRNGVRKIHSTLHKALSQA